MRIIHGAQEWPRRRRHTLTLPTLMRWTEHQRKRRRQVSILHSLSAPGLANRCVCQFRHVSNRSTWTRTRNLRVQSAVLRLLSYRPKQERQDSNLRMVVLEATAVAAEPLSQKVRGRIRTAVMTLCRRLPRLSATRTYEMHAPHLNADREHRTRTGHPTGF